MPLKPPFTGMVLTGHRGTVIKSHLDNRVVSYLFGQPKDEALLPKNRARCDQPAQKRRAPVPVFSLKRVTPSTRLTDNNALARAARKTSTRVYTVQDLCCAVSGHIRAEWRRFRTESGSDAVPIIVLGDQHNSPGSLLKDLVAVHTVGPGATMLFEVDRNEFETLLRWAHTFDQQLSEDPSGDAQWINDLIYSGDAAVSETATYALLVLAALRSGAKVDYFDIEHTSAANAESREARMLDGIANHSRNFQAPLLIATGTLHVAKLLPHLETFNDVMAICNSNITPDSSDVRKSVSYLFSTDRIMKLDDRGVDASGPDVAGFFVRRFGSSGKARWTGPGQIGQYVGAAHSSGAETGHVDNPA